MEQIVEASRTRVTPYSVYSFGPEGIPDNQFLADQLQVSGAGSQQIDFTFSHKGEHRNTDHEVQVELRSLQVRLTQTYNSKAYKILDGWLHTLAQARESESRCLFGQCSSRT